MFSVILIEVCDVLDDLLIAELLEGLFPRETQYLPKDDGEGPHVTFCRELVLEKIGIR